MSIAAKHPAEVSASVVVIIRRAFSEPAGAQELVVCGEMGALGFTWIVQDILPSAIGQVPMVATSNQIGSVLQRDTNSRLDAAPVRKHRRLGISPVLSIEARAVNNITHAQFGEWTSAPICHQD